MTMNKLLGITLAIVMLTGSISLGFSEPLRVQLEQGIETSELQCDNPNHVLVQRTSGSLACVSQSSAERTGWEIIEIASDFKQVQVKDNLEINDNVEISTNKVNTVKNYWMPNPDEDIEEFTNKFALAAGVTLSGERSEHDQYKMDPHVRLTINHFGADMRLGESDIDASQSEKFVRDFMDYMGFEYKEKDFHERPTYGEYQYPKDIQSYLISNEHSSIRFEFIHYDEEVYEGEHYDENHVIKIAFTGWTNHPESIIFTITEEEALQYAEEFSNDLNRNLNLLEGYGEDEDSGCKSHNEVNPEYPRELYISKKVVKGIPYYVTEVGICGDFENPNAMGLGMFSRLMLHQDAVNGTDIFIEHGSSGE